MPGSHPARWIAFLICGALTAFGCAGTDTTQQGETGALSLNLELGDVDINEVHWTISRQGMEDMEGDINTSAPGATASVEVFGLPPGAGYTVTLRAIATDGETVCVGSEMFAIELGEVEEVEVYLRCKGPERFGSVRVNGELNVCAYLYKMVVSPLTTSVGNDIDVSAVGLDEEGDQIEYRWSNNGGAFGDPTADETTYTCDEVGNHEITVTVTDDGEPCEDSWTVPVTCVPSDGLECIDDEGCDIGEVCNDNNQCVPVDPCDGVDCSDGNECTDDVCIAGNCTNPPNDGPCDGGAGTCEDSVCVPVDGCDGVDCSDGNECTDDVCIAGNCTNPPNDGPCDGGAGTCEDSVCVPDVECTEDVDCDDGDICVVNVCRPDPDLFCDTGLCVLDAGLRADCAAAFLGCLAGNPDEEECIAESLAICIECDTGLDCGDDNECTDNVCTAGVCSNPNNDDMCDGGAGVCEVGVCVPVDPCEGVDCSDGNECTGDVCINGNCSNPPVEGECEGGAGFCEDGSCNVGACTNAADLNVLAGNGPNGDDDPPTATVTACSTTAAVVDKSYCPGPWGTGTDSSGLNMCLQDGNGGANPATALSVPCSSCTADISCCTLNNCSILVQGPCAGAPQLGDACDLCIRSMCADAFEDCSGLPYEL